MTLLANVLQGDRADLDVIQLALETLANVMTFEADNIEGNTYLFTSSIHNEHFFFRTTKSTSRYNYSIYR